MQIQREKIVLFRRFNQLVKNLQDPGVPADIKTLISQDLKQTLRQYIKRLKAGESVVFWGDETEYFAAYSAAELRQLYSLVSISLRNEKDKEKQKELFERIKKIQKMLNIECGPS